MTLVGKTWTLHVDRVLGTTRAENLRMIGESVAWFKQLGREVIYDAEHFFDGYRLDPAYALETLVAAAEAGADALVLCDTNGGSCPEVVAERVAEVREPPRRAARHPPPQRRRRWRWPTRWRRCAPGCGQVQGTINGYGERCGNVDLVPVIANLAAQARRAGPARRSRCAG